MQSEGAQSQDTRFHIGKILSKREVWGLQVLKSLVAEGPEFLTLTEVTHLLL